MPAITTCPHCGFHGNHGFIIDTDKCSGIKFYHGSGKGYHEWFKNGEKVLLARLESFKYGAKRQGIPSKSIWYRAMVARITGDEKKAKKLFKQWSESYL